MSERTVVVLGAADGAIGSVQAIRRLGLRSLCVDRRRDAPAVAIADEFVEVSTRDVDCLVERLERRTDLAGVISPASDVNLPAQLAVADRLSLPTGLSKEAVRASVDKGYFRRICAELGLPGPRFVHGDPDDVARRAVSMRLPVIVKPTDSSGGRGISCCDSHRDLADACQLAARWSPTEQVIVEEYVGGQHLTAEAIIDDGEVGLLGVGLRQLTAPPHFVTVEHTMPIPGRSIAAQIRAVLHAVCRRLGYRWGSLNADVLVTPRGEIILVEMGARLGGNGSAELLGLVHGVNATEIAIRLVTGERPCPQHRQRWHAAFRVLSAPAAGKLAAIDGLDEVRSDPAIVDVVIAAQPGDHVVPYTRAGAKVGYLLAAADSHEHVRSALTRAQRTLQLEVCDTGYEEWTP